MSAVSDVSEYTTGFSQACHHVLNHRPWRDMHTWTKRRREGYQDGWRYAQEHLADPVERSLIDQDHDRYRGLLLNDPEQGWNF